MNAQGQATGSQLASAVAKSRMQLIPFMFLLYVISFLDRSNLSFAKESYQIDIGLTNEAYALGAGIFFVTYGLLAIPSNLVLCRWGARKWIGAITVTWGILSALHAYADSEAKFLILRTLLGAAEAGFFPGVIYLTSLWFPKQNRAGVIGLFYMGVPAALMFGSPISGALLEMHGFLGQPGWYWLFMIEGLLAVIMGLFAFYWIDDSPEHARFLKKDEKSALIKKLTEEKSPLEQQQSSKNIIRHVIFNPYIWRLLLFYLSIQISFYGLIYFLPTQVASLLGRKVGFMVSLVTAIPWVAAVLGAWFIPRYADRRGERTRMKIATLTLLAAGIGVGASSSSDPLLAMVALCLSGLCFLSCAPVFWSITTQAFSGTRLAGLIGLINCCGTGAGGFLAPIIRVKAESLFSSDSAGLLTLGGVAVAGAFLMVFNLKHASR
ncbi:MAG: MFS transporter [Hyphomicrobiales bacterium]